MGDAGIELTKPKNLDYTISAALSISEVRIRTYDNITPLGRTSVGIYAEPDNWALSEAERVAGPDSMESIIILDTQIANELLWDVFKMPNKILRVNLRPVDQVHPTDKYLPGGLKLKELQEINVTRHDSTSPIAGKIHLAELYGRFEDTSADAAYRKHAEYNLKLVISPKEYRQLKNPPSAFRVKFALCDPPE